MIDGLVSHQARLACTIHRKINQLSDDNSGLYTYKSESSIMGSYYNALTRIEFILFGQALCIYVSSISWNGSSK